MIMTGMLWDTLYSDLAPVELKDAVTILPSYDSQDKPSLPYGQHILRGLIA